MARCAASPSGWQWPLGLLTQRWHCVHLGEGPSEDPDTSVCLIHLNARGLACHAVGCLVQIALLLHGRFFLFNVGVVCLLEVHRNCSKVLEGFDLCRSRVER